MAALASDMKLSARQKRFVNLYIMMLLVAFGPSKVLGAALPAIFISGLIFYVALAPDKHILKYLVFVILYGMAGLFYSLALPEFSQGNYYLFLVTASSVLILVYDFRSIVSNSLLNLLGKVTLWFLAFQSCVGIVQGLLAFARVGNFDLATGDAVRGTIALTIVRGTGSNVMYGILLSSLFLFVLATHPKSRGPKRRLAYFLILLAWVMASVLHTMVFFVTAAVLGRLLFVGVRTKHGYSTAFAQMARRKSSKAVLTLMVVLLPMAFLMLPKNVRSLPALVRRSLVFDEEAPSEKAIATYHTIIHLREDVPIQPFIGIGPGQYSSRASLIRSDEYLRRGKIKLFPKYVGSYADRYILSLWRAFPERHPHGGSTYVPFYSWLSLYGELGLFGVILACWIIFKGIRRARRSISVVFPALPYFILVLLLYVALLGFHNNYWEWAQAVFPAFLVMKLGYTYMAATSGREKISDPTAPQHTRGTGNE